MCLSIVGSSGKFSQWVSFMRHWCIQLIEAIYVRMDLWCIGLDSELIMSVSWTRHIVHSRDWNKFKYTSSLCNHQIVFALLIRHLILFSVSNNFLDFHFFLCLYLQGDLKRYLRAQRKSDGMTPDLLNRDLLTLQRMAYEITSGLLHLHENNYIHR